jgi:putative peptidoglycan lipid II flippase
MLSLSRCVCRIFSARFLPKALSPPPFVPLYATEQEKHGLPAAQKFAGQALAILMVVLIPFSVLVMLFMPHVMFLLAHGFEQDPAKYDLAVNFSLITFPYLTLISITALQSGLLNARERFAPGAVAPVIFNIILIIGLVLAKILGWHLGYAASWSMTIAGVIQLVWLAVSCHRAGVPIPLLWPRFTESSKRLFRRIGPGSIGCRRDDAFAASHAPYRRRT